MCTSKSRLMKPRARPEHLLSETDSDGVKGVKETWMVAPLFAGITLIFKQK